jgi:hypothetical protein
MLLLIACHHDVGRASDRLRVSHLRHGTSAMHARADPDHHLECAMRVGARDFSCRHQVQQGGLARCDLGTERFAPTVEQAVAVLGCYWSCPASCIGPWQRRWWTLLFIPVTRSPTIG